MSAFEREIQQPTNPDLRSMSDNQLSGFRASRWSEMKELHAQVVAANRDVTPVEADAWTVAEIHLNRANNELARRGFDTSRGFNEIERDPIVTTHMAGPEAGRDDSPHGLAFREYLLTGEARELHAYRAQGAGSGSIGGYTVPQGFRKIVTETMKAYGGMRNLATVITTDTGNDLPWPTNDDTSNSGSGLTAENTPITEQALTFGQKTLKAYNYPSGVVLASIQFMQDSGIDAEQFVAKKLAQRVARAEAPQYITGAGTTQPQGILVGATSGLTSASTTAVTYDELVNLVASVDPAYLQPTDDCAWLMSNATLGSLRKIRDDSGGAGLGRPLIEPSVQGGMPDRLLGYKIQIDQAMPALTATNKAIAFGNFKAAYVIRDVGSFEVLRLDERYADALQVGFLGWHRTDGLVQDASAVKFITQHA